jgi:hypothetical protein
MLKAFAFLTKREDLTTEAFIDHYENKHIPLVRSLIAVPPVYKRNNLVRGHELNREDDSIDFDVITELVFPDAAGYLEWGKTLGVEEIATDEQRFLDRTRTRAYIIEEHATSG